MNKYNIILYHQESCPQCKMIEKLLKSKNIEYTSCMDIETMKSKGLRMTPVLEVDGKLLMGKELFSWVNSRGN